MTQLATRVWRIKPSLYEASFNYVPSIGHKVNKRVIPIRLRCKRSRYKQEDIILSSLSGDQNQEPLCPILAHHNSVM